MNKYDLLLLVDNKDYNKLPLCIEKCLQYLEPKPSSIYIVSSDNIIIENLNIDIPIYYYIDDDILPIKKEDINYRRKGWIFKQFINLFQNITQERYYLSVDTDLFFTKPLNLFSNNKPIFFITNRDQYHKPYFECMKKLFNVDKICQKTFICDFMMFDKILRNNIWEIYQYTVSSLFNKLNPILSEECLFCDYEPYGTLIQKYYPNEYIFADIKTQLFGRFNQCWSENEILELINANKEYNLITTHTWI